MSRIWLVRLAISASCVVSAAPAGSAATGRRPVQAIPLAGRPPAVLRFCRERAQRRKFAVLCPSRWPHVPLSTVTASGTSVLGPSFYWGSFNDASGFDDGDNGHLVIGGQRPRFSVEGRANQTWPRPGKPQPISQLGLPRPITMPTQGGRVTVVQRPARIIGASRVDHSRALVLLAPAYPAGGFNGGHVIVVWNWDSHGYFVSLHYSGARRVATYTLAERMRAALAIARTARPLPNRRH